MNSSNQSCDFSQVRNDMRGKELSILAGLGIELPHKPNIGAPCPSCGGRDRFSWVMKDNWVYECRGCGGGDAFNLVTKLNGGDPIKAAQQVMSDHYSRPLVPRVANNSNGQEQVKAAKKAKALLVNSVVRDDHPYLENRGLNGIEVDSINSAVTVGGISFPAGSLIVPVSNGIDDVNVQLINDQGDKRYLAGGQKRGCYYLLGADNPSKILLVEGFATGVSVWLAHQREEAVGVCFDAGNLKPVANQLRAHGLPLVFMADNDESGVGEKKARAAAQHNEQVFLPPVFGDWDDYRQNGGDIAQAVERLKGTSGKEVSQELKQKNVFHLVNGFDGFDIEFSYLIKGYLPANSLGMVYGASGSFKSFHALSWAVHVALGKPWNGQRVNKTPVLYIAGEGGIGVPRRIKALADTYNNGKPIENLYRLDHPVAMGSVADIDQLIRTMEEKSNSIGVKFGLVIIDTLARCFGSGDENKTEDMSRFVAACDRMKSHVGATVIVVHHSGVADKERARGSSALRAACDFEYRVDRVKDDAPAFVLTSTKAKDDKEKPQQMFRMAPVSLFTDSDGDEVQTLVASNVGEEPPVEEEQQETRLTDTEQMVYQVVRARQQAGHPTTRGMVRDDLKAQGISTKSLSRWLNGCMEKGVIDENEGSYFTQIAS
ncbi:AAA family ATPase [Vibrio profundum]|uniref:AAA family ATPase n=1 Tax=Vibrio profundum TaxID=2910247 RepID=UPI003D09C6E7